MEWIIRLVLEWMNKDASRAALDERGRKVLYYGNKLKIVGAVITIFWLAFILIGLTGVFKGTKEDMMLVIALFSIFAAIGLFVLIEAYFVKIIYDDTLIISYSPWRRDIRMIPWGDIESVKYSKIMQGYICKTRNHGKLILYPYLTGLNEFLEILEEKSEQELR